MPAQPGTLLSQQREQSATRNSELDTAWQIYAAAFTEWSRVSESRILSDRDGYQAAELARQRALIHLRELRDQALFEYFEVFEADQQERFGNGN